MSLLLCLFTVLLLSSCPSSATVTLTSSADTLCPGDTVVFTCVTTDTGRLVWDLTHNNIKHSFHSSSQISIPVTVDIFTLTLVSVTNSNTYQSTVVAHNVSIDYNGAKVSCSDDIALSSKLSAIIDISSPPSPPLNLTAVVSVVNSSVTISWVAPLDTPLCVHSYTVTVRNSCDSSQVMVYNTTDNRSSLNITDLTSDGEYSVTVAGRDGAGRLGQESEELRISSKILSIELIGYSIFYNRVFLQWNLTEQLCYPVVQYLITHNVSSDQSPITVNRTNVTLYGVQPGETYTVEITPCYDNTMQCRQAELKKFTFTIPGVESTNYSLLTSSYIMSYTTHTLIINSSIETTAKSLMPNLSYETCCPKLQTTFVPTELKSIETTGSLMPSALIYEACCPKPHSTSSGSFMVYKTNSPTSFNSNDEMMTPWTMIILVVLSVVVVLVVLSIIVILILFCLLLLKKATFNNRMKATVCKDQLSGRNIEASQPPANWERHVGNLVGLEGVEVKKEVSEGDYEEIGNILNTPFTMEYNMSYSMVAQTAL